MQGRKTIYFAALVGGCMDIQMKFVESSCNPYLGTVWEENYQYLLCTQLLPNFI